MSLVTALKGAVADVRPLQNPDVRRLWVTQIITHHAALLRAITTRLCVDVRLASDETRLGWPRPRKLPGPSCSTPRAPKICPDLA